MARAVKEIGRSVTGVQGDVGNLADLDRLFAQIKLEKGKLDIVFANAGAADFALLGKITEEHYDAIFNGNVKGVLFTVQKSLPLLPDGASIILNASIAGRTAFAPEWSVYNATKAAVRSFAREMDNRLEGSSHSRERGEPGLYRYASMAFHRSGRGTDEGHFQHYSARQVRHTR